MDSVLLVALFNVWLAATANGFVFKRSAEGILWSNDPHCGEGEHKGTNLSPNFYFRILGIYVWNFEKRMFTLLKLGSGMNF